jgi:hypothetical protein
MEFYDELPPTVFPIPWFNEPQLSRTTAKGLMALVLFV